MMTIDDLEIYRNLKTSNPSLYEQLKRVENISAQNSNDHIEYQRRLQLLASHISTEEKAKHITTFNSESLTFDALHEKLLKPHWIPESTEKGVKTPDMYYTKAGIKIPVEVKTIDFPKIESENLRGKTGSLQPERNTREISFSGIAKKLDDSFESSAKKFDLFNRISASRGELWLYYLASCDVILETNGRSSTVKRIDDYTSVHVPKNISYRIFDLLSITGWQETQ